MNDIQFVGEHITSSAVCKHEHDCWELIYCTKGEGRYLFEDGLVISYKEGEAVAIPPFMPHSSTTDSDYAIIYLRISDPNFPCSQPFLVSDDPLSYLKIAFQQSKYYYPCDLKVCNQVLSALGELIVNYMSMFLCNVAYSEPVKKIRSRIMISYANPDFALDAYIKTLPFQYDYLRKLFKKEVGITPLEFMTRLRMKRACVILTSKGADKFTIAQIAQKCGYEDPLYFSRVFKKIYGVCPSSFAGRC